MKRRIAVIAGALALTACGEKAAQYNTPHEVFAALGAGDDCAPAELLCNEYVPGTSTGAFDALKIPADKWEKEASDMPSSNGITYYSYSYTPQKNMTINMTDSPFGLLLIVMKLGSKD